MPYNITRASACHGPPFFEDSQFYSQETASIIQTAWNENIDPLLQSSPTSRKGSNEDITMTLQHQNPSLERFLMHNENHFLYDTERMQHHPQGVPHALNRTVAPIASLPHTPGHRLSSPCPSHDPTSSCSSARTPGSDNEWEPQFSPIQYSRDEFYLPQATSFIGHGFPEWTGGNQQAFPQQNGFPCVQMSQIQGLPDLQPEEAMYETIDEAYNSIEVKNVYSVSDNQIMHLKHEHSIAYNYQIDEGIGASIKDEGSLPDVAPAHSHLDAMSEADADGELEEDTEVIPEPLSDTEYTPKRSRARKARSPRASPQYHPLKSGRIHKSSSKARGNVICKQCEHAPFKDTTALQRHITSSHTRAFICVFNFAGCGATFTSKNEWKRHVSSQHLNLTAWVCDIGTCGKNNSSGKSKPAEFNRKDLFTQHLRRMHTPFQVKRNKDKKNLEWEEKLKDLQKECLVMKREPPMQLACPLPGCGAYFEGQGTWDDRMEHVGKHLEKAAAGVGECVRQEDDALLVEWAAREGILMRKPGFSGWRLCVDNGNGKKDEDRDADGEEEFL